MASLNIPNTFSNSTIADATQVNANFDSVKTFAESQVVQVDGSVKAPTAAIADGAVTTAKLATDSVTADKIAANAVGSSEIANGSVTATKLASGTYALTYQDFVITLDPNNNPYGQTVNMNLTGGKYYANVVSVVGWGALNSNASVSTITLGGWSGVQDNTQVRAFVSLGNNVASNNVILRVWLI